MPPMTSEEEAILREVIEEELRTHPRHTVRISIAWSHLSCDVCDWRHNVSSRELVRDLAEIARKHEETPVL